MLVIAYKQTDRIQIPPVFLQIDEKIQVATTEEIINRVYQSIKRYLSPFVTPSHLELRLKNQEVLYRKIPLFVYFNYGEAFQYFFCSVNAKEVIAHENYKYDELFLNVFTRVSHRNPSPIHQTAQYKEKLKKFKILSKSQAKGMEEMCKEILPTDNVIIAGKRICLSNKDATWSSIICEKWQQLQNIRDRCLYICIDRVE